MFQTKQLSSSASKILKKNYGKQMPKFDYTPPKYDGKTIDELMKIRKEHMNPAMLAYYKKPIMLTNGKMQYLFDEKGNRYLDFLGFFFLI
jgi:alanine-glyoxylate transaminase / (R)-3-amino-2-methylpropionate-pyruvate transaminase